MPSRRDRVPPLILARGHLLLQDQRTQKTGQDTNTGTGSINWRGAIGIRGTSASARWWSWPRLDHRHASARRTSPARTGRAGASLIGPVPLFRFRPAFPFAPSTRQNRRSEQNSTVFAPPKAAERADRWRRNWDRRFGKA